MTPEEVQKEKARFEEIDSRGRLYITPEEMAELIRLSSRERPVRFQFGPGWASMPVTQENMWAFHALVEMRTAKALADQEPSR